MMVERAQVCFFIDRTDSVYGKEVKLDNATVTSGSPRTF